MFITKKEHNRIIQKLEEFYEDQHKALSKELEESRDLKSILEKLSRGLTLTGTGNSLIIKTDDCGSYSVSLSDDIPQYVEDYLGGKVIKQEATKVIEITKEGEVKTGLTKQHPDSGYSYKLIRNK